MKKLLILVMAGAISIAALGVGYAMWSDTLTMVGTVATGSVDIDWSGPLFHDDESIEAVLIRPDGTPCLPGDPVDLCRPTGDTNEDPDTSGEIKNVGQCSAGYKRNADGTIDDSTLLISVGNAYPSYDCWVEFDVHYNGTIPGHTHVTPLQLPSGVTPLPPAALNWDCTFAPNDGSGQQFPVNDITYLNLKQLHQSDRLDCVLRIHFKNADGLQQLTGYGFGWTIVANQYNEDPLP